MTRDSVLLVILVLTFATLVSTHATIVIGLLRRRPRWRGLAVLLLVPLAPWWGWKERMRVRGAIWMAAATGYAAALALSFKP